MDKSPLQLLDMSTDLIVMLFTLSQLQVQPKNKFVLLIATIDSLSLVQSVFLSKFFGNCLV